MLPSSVSNRQPQEPGESWEVGIGVTLTPKRRVGAVDGHKTGVNVRQPVAQLRQARAVAKMGQAVFFKSVPIPEIWSEWVWVIKIASSSAEDNSSAFSAAVMRRQEMPASIRNEAPSQESRAALPEEPLARVCTVVKKNTSLCIMKKASAGERAGQGRHTP